MVQNGHALPTLSIVTGFIAETFYTVLYFDAVQWVEHSYKLNVMTTALFSAKLIIGVCVQEKNYYMKCLVPFFFDVAHVDPVVIIVL